MVSVHHTLLGDKKYYDLVDNVYTETEFNKRYKELGCPIKLQIEIDDRPYLAPKLKTDNFFLDRFCSWQPPILIYQRGVSFGYFRFWLEQMGLFPELIQKIWLTMVTQMVYESCRIFSRWGPEKHSMLLEGLMIKIE